jgi:hypothetical protein
MDLEIMSEPDTELLERRWTPEAPMVSAQMELIHAFPLLFYSTATVSYTLTLSMNVSFLQLLITHHCLRRV